MLLPSTPVLITLFSFLPVAFDLFALRWNSYEAVLRSQYSASPFMTDFFQRLHKSNLVEEKTLSADMLLEHPWLKPANDKANEVAILGIVRLAKAAKKRIGKHARPSAERAPRNGSDDNSNKNSALQVLALSINVPLLGLRNELFEFRNARADVKAGKHNVGRVKGLVLHYFVVNVMLPTTTRAEEFFFVVPRKHARAVRLDDSAEFSDYRGLRGRNGEFRLLLLHVGGASSNRRPAPPPRDVSPRRARSPGTSPRGVRARPRSMSPRSALGASPRHAHQDGQLSPRGRPTGRGAAGSTVYSTLQNRQANDPPAQPQWMSERIESSNAGKSPQQDRKSVV